MESLPFEILVIIAENITGDTVGIDASLVNTVNSLAAVSKLTLEVVKAASWRAKCLFKDRLISTYGVEFEAEYRYLNRLTVAKLLSIDNSPCICEYTPYSNSISKLTSADINVISHTKSHGITWFDILKVIIMLRKELRFIVIDSNQYSDEILRLGEPVVEYGDESGLMIIDYLSGILSEIAKTEEEANKPDEHGFKLDERMLNCLSEYFRTMIFKYSDYIHKVNGDKAFLQIMEMMLRGISRERVYLSGPERNDEDVIILNTLGKANSQICTYLNAFKFAFKFECKIYITSNITPGTYFYQFEKLQNGYYISRITKLN